MCDAAVQNINSTQQSYRQSDKHTWQYLPWCQEPAGSLQGLLELALMWFFSIITIKCTVKTPIHQPVSSWEGFRHCIKNNKDDEEHRPEMLHLWSLLQSCTFSVSGLYVQRERTRWGDNQVLLEPVRWFSTWQNILCQKLWRTSRNGVCVCCTDGASALH